MTIKVGAFSPFLIHSKMNLELLMGKGAASPHPKPLYGLSTPGVCVSAGALSPQGQDSAGKAASHKGS